MRTTIIYELLILKLLQLEEKEGVGWGGMCVWRGSRDWNSIWKWKMHLFYCRFLAWGFVIYISGNFYLLKIYQKFRRENCHKNDFFFYLIVILITMNGEHRRGECHLLITLAPSSFLIQLFCCLFFIDFNSFVNFVFLKAKIN